MHFPFSNVSHVLLNWGRMQQAWKKSYWFTESRVELESSYEVMLCWNCVDDTSNGNHAVFILSYRSPITGYLYLTLVSGNYLTPESAQPRKFYTVRDGLGLRRQCYTETA